MENPERTTREERVYDLLEDRIREEIRFLNDSDHLGLTDDVVESLVFGIADGVAYAFKIDWDPGWVGRGKFHAWREGDVTRARCPICLVDSPPSFNERAASDWVRTHMATDHR